MSLLLEMLDDPDVPTRELALSLLVEILEKHRKAMESCIEILIVKLLHATKDAALKLVNRLSQENLMAHLSTFFPALLDAFENHSPYVRKFLCRPKKLMSIVHA
ncbi:CLIP-associated protein-like isoform X6 [Panicum virgatum]|uniref:CLIP-associated protein-like isoform X6 n=1 Tax=Panicum virgatum TaxID=38727 RepID=UPI0019D64D1E|nr:CLIP-associated protein-like isoform X6 [Panicum virgatum]